MLTRSAVAAIRTAGLRATSNLPAGFAGLQGTAPFSPTMDREVTLYEVGPRDGLQNEKEIVSTEDKLKFIDMLSESGLPFVETTSFVSPKWVPQMADHKEICSGLKRHDGVGYPVLTPNVKGLEGAITAGEGQVALFTAASEAFSLKNTNMSLAKSREVLKDVASTAHANHMWVRGYVSTVVGCPEQGAVPVQDVVDSVRHLREIGCHDISLGDTIGVGTVALFKELYDALEAEGLMDDRLAIHCHDTYGRALENVIYSMERGIKTVDSSAGGLGGCPYAKGATGNLATEDILFWLNEHGVKTGVDFPAIVEASEFIYGAMGRPVKGGGRLQEYISKYQ